MDFEIHARNPDAGSIPVRSLTETTVTCGNVIFFSYKVLKNLAEVSSSVLWKAELASDETGYPVRWFLS